MNSIGGYNNHLIKASGLPNQALAISNRAQELGEMPQDTFTSSKSANSKISQENSPYERLSNNIFERLGSSINAIRNDSIPRLLSFTGISDDIRPHERYYIENTLDTNRDNAINQAELAAALSDMDHSLQGDTPLETREYQNGLISTEEIKAHIAESYQEYLLEEIAKGENLSTGALAQERLRTGTYSGMMNNALKEPLPPGEATTLMINEAIYCYDQNIQTLGEERGRDFFIQRLSEGTVGKVDISAETGNLVYYTTSNEVDGERVNAYWETREYAANNFNEIISANRELNVSMNNGSSVNHDRSLIEPPIFQESLARITETILTPERVTAISSQLDLNNPEAIKTCLEALAEDVSEAMNNPIDIELTVQEGYLDDLRAIAKTSNTGTGDIKLFLRPYKQLYEANISTGATQEEAHRNVCSYFIETIVHESWHLKQQQLENSLLTDFNENDLRSILTLNSEPYFTAGESEALTGQKELYTGSLAEAQAFRAAEIVRNHMNTY